MTATPSAYRVSTRAALWRPAFPNGRALHYIRHGPSKQASDEQVNDTYSSCSYWRPSIAWLLCKDR
jgi:hypothetical protein